MRELESVPREPPPKPPQVRGGRILALLGIAVVAGSVGVASGWGRLHEQRTTTVHAEGPLVPARAAAGRSWYEPSPFANPAPGPLVVGERLLGMAWGDDQLYVVAYDRATLHVEWLAGPWESRHEEYRSRFWLAADETRVFLSDFRGAIHILDTATGKSLGTAANLPPRTAVGCFAADTTKRPIAALHTDDSMVLSDGWSEHDDVKIFDPERLALIPAPTSGRCRQEPEHDPPLQGNQWCGVDWASVPGAQANNTTSDCRRTAGKWQVRVRVVDGHVEVTGKSAASTWSARDPEWVLAGMHEPLVTMLRGHLVLGLRTQSDELRLIGLDPSTGETRYETRPISRPGRVPYLAAAGTELFVPNDDEMFVVDLGTGVLRGRLVAP